MKKTLFVLLSAATLPLTACGLSSEKPTDIVGIEVVSVPTKVRYHVGDPLKTAGLKVNKIQRDGTAIALNSNEYTISDNYLDILGNREITVNYETFSDSFLVKVVEDKTVSASSLSTTQQDAIKNQFFSQALSHTYNGTTVKYRKYEPTDSVLEKLPLVIMLHGAGERGSDNFLQLKNSFWRPFTRTDSLLLDAVCIAPQCPVAPDQWVDTPWGNGNYSTASVAESDQLKTVFNLIETLKTQPNIDSNRIYVTGISMGGFGTWDLMARHPETFAAGVPLCGGGDPSKADVLSNIPILTFHGDKDTTVPYSGTQGMYTAINAMGKNSIRFITLTGKSHNIWDIAWDYTENGTFLIEEFLFSKTKN